MAHFLLEGIATFGNASNLVQNVDLRSGVTHGIENVDGIIRKLAPYVLPSSDPERSTKDDPKCNSSDQSQPQLLSCPKGLKIYETAQEELNLVRSAHRTLATTGCTRNFCQSGRATKTFEPRIGRDRPLCEIKNEAEDFLRECRDNDIIETDYLLEKRINSAVLQIEESALRTSVVYNDGRVSEENAGGVWQQTSTELQYGLRTAWKNSKRCIMRSEHGNLRLCDLRHTTSSREMAHELIRNLIIAFNGGRIQPTAFVFPARRPGRRGTMIWNEQLLAFAGYQEQNGSILGDPKNVELTNAMVELGWRPPSPKSRWDILPLVLMADGDDPYLVELPAQLAKTVHITHPRYQKEFEQLDLRWILFPALSRLGFDIGGVQYTAAPFLGWFMDAEIGIRNLADTFRYNVLPDVVEALKLSDRPGTPLEDLPEYLRLAALSRAQAELNLAVYYSYENAKVMMIDTMTASLNYMQFDDHHQKETGFRLPADPYWLAPPQGSIVPIWHRGAAPNYQPKPMIARHVQDPIKAWRREHSNHPVRPVRGEVLARRNIPAQRRVSIFTCSDGITAGKLGKRLYERLTKLKYIIKEDYEVQKPEPLSQLLLSDCGHSDTILIIASSTGRGELPRNAKKFMASHGVLSRITDAPNFSIYGNGDRTHGDTYNAAAINVQKCMSDLGCSDIMGGMINGDTAFQNPDWQTFNAWAQQIEGFLCGNRNMDGLQIRQISYRPARGKDEMQTATMIRKVSDRTGGLTLVTFDIGNVQYTEMDHFKIMTPNAQADTALAMKRLGMDPSDKLSFHHVDVSTYLQQIVDLSLSFKTLDWLQDIDALDQETEKDLRKESVMNVLSKLKTTPDTILRERILQDMPSIQPRHFSAASSPAFKQRRPDQETLLDILVKINVGGRFSDSWLSRAQVGDSVRFCLAKSGIRDIVYRANSATPMIVIAIGSGMGPVASLLQRLVADLRQSSSIANQNTTADEDISCDHDSSSSSPEDTDQEDEHSRSVSSSTSTCDSHCASEHNNLKNTNVAEGEQPKSHHSLIRSVSLFAGFKERDKTMIENIIRPAVDVGLFDCLELCPSNPDKRRIQDHLMKPGVMAGVARKLKNPACVVYICASTPAMEDSVKNLSQILGEDVRVVLGDRLVIEVFRG